MQVKPLDVQEIPAIAASMHVPFNAHQLLRFGVAVLEWMHAYCCQHVAEHVSFAYEPEHKRISAQVREGGALPQRLEPYFPCEDVS